MFIMHFFNTLREVNLEDVSSNSLQKLTAYAAYNIPSFVHDIKKHQPLLERCVDALPHETKKDLHPIYNALTLYTAAFNEPKYKEHVLQKYVVEGHLHGVAVGIELGVDVNTVIGYIPDLSRSQIVQGLLQLCSFELPRAWTSNTHRCTPLVLAASLGHFDLVKLLVEKGADLNSETKHHNTALDWATKRGHRDVEDYLISRGALRNRTSDKGIEVLSSVNV